MLDQAQRKKILTTLSSEIAILLNEKLDQVLLFGSYARGKARADSDLDILIVAQRKLDYADSICCTSELSARVSLEMDICNRR